MPNYKYTVKGDKNIREGNAPSKAHLEEMLRMVGENVENIMDVNDLAELPPLSDEEIKKMGLDPEIEKLSRQQEKTKQKQPHSQIVSDTPAPIYKSTQTVTLMEEQATIESESFFEQGNITFMLKGGKLYVKNWKECDKKDFRIFRKNKNGNLVEITNNVVIEKLDWNEVPQKTK